MGQVRAGDGEYAFDKRLVENHGFKDGIQSGDVQYSLRQPAARGLAAEGSEDELLVAVRIARRKNRHVDFHPFLPDDALELRDEILQVLSKGDDRARRLQQRLADAQTLHNIGCSLVEKSIVGAERRLGFDAIRHENGRRAAGQGRRASGAWGLNRRPDPPRRRT